MRFDAGLIRSLTTPTPASLYTNIELDKLSDVRRPSDGMSVWQVVWGGGIRDRNLSGEQITERPWAA